MDSVAKFVCGKYVLVICQYEYNILVITKFEAKPRAWVTTKILYEYAGV